MLVFLLQVVLDPVVKAHDLFAKLGLSNKHMLKSTGVSPIPQRMSLLGLIDLTYQAHPVYHVKLKMTFNLPSIAVSVIDPEPYFIQVCLELPHVSLGLALLHQVLVCSLEEEEHVTQSCYFNVYNKNW